MTALAWPNLLAGRFDGEQFVTVNPIDSLTKAHESLITRPVDTQFPEVAITAATHDGTHLLIGVVPVSPINTPAGTVNLVLLFEVKLQAAGSAVVGFQPYDFNASAVIGSEVVTASLTNTTYADLTVTIPASSFTSKLDDTNIRISARKVSGQTCDLRCLYLASRWERI